MLKHIFNKGDSLFFFKKKLALSWRAPQENDAKFRFPIHVQGIRQFHDNCKNARLLPHWRPSSLYTGTYVLDKFNSECYE